MGRREQQCYARLHCSESLSDNMFALQSAIDLADKYITDNTFVRINDINALASEYLDLVGDEKSSIIQFAEAVERAANKKECPELFHRMLSSLHLAMLDYCENDPKSIYLDEDCKELPLPQSEYWDTVSNKVLLDYMEQTQQTSLSRILFQPRHARMLKAFLEPLKETSPAPAQQQEPPSRPSSLSTTLKRAPKAPSTPKKKRQATATSTMSAPTAKAVASASSLSSFLHSSEDELATMLESIPSKPSYSATGSSIFYKNQGKSYSFKSAQFPIGKTFIDLKIYNNPQLMKETKPMEQWKTSSFRAKCLIDRKDSDPKTTDQIQTHLSALRTLLLKDIQTYPELESYQESL